jgi:hypothetical protein
MRLKATEMVGLQFTPSEAQRLLDALHSGKLGPTHDPELVALERKLKVLLQVASATDERRASASKRL